MYLVMLAKAFVFTISMPKQNQPKISGNNISRELNASILWIQMLIKYVNEAYSQRRAFLNSPKLGVRAILLEELNILLF